MAMPIKLEQNPRHTVIDRALQHSLVRAGAMLNRDMFKLLSKTVRTFSSAGAETVVRLADDALFSFPMGDNYWSKAMFLKSAYEPEIRFLMQAIAGVEFDFIDCGANYGYWSVMASSKALGAHRVIAVEAAQSNMTQLTANARLNGDRFQILHRAIFSRSGEHLQVFGKNHFGLTISPGSSAKRDTLQSFTVETITLDDVAAQLPSGRSVVIKLDVEGAEQEAFAGAAKLLQRDSLFLYEDERADAAHTISAMLIDNLGFAVFAIWPDRPPTLIKTINDVTDAKSAGIFNFAATPHRSNWSAMLADKSVFSHGNVT